MAEEDGWMDGSTCIRSRYYADSFELLLVSLRWLLWLSHLVVCEYQLKLKQLCPGQDAAFLWVVVDKKQLNRYKLNSMCYGVGVLIIRQDKTLIWALPYWLDANNNEHTSFFFFYSFFFFLLRLRVGKGLTIEIGCNSLIKLHLFNLWMRKGFDGVTCSNRYLDNLKSALAGKPCRGFFLIDCSNW